VGQGWECIVADSWNAIAISGAGRPLVGPHNCGRKVVVRTKGLVDTVQ
jgi:hypothetical protein